MNFFGVLSFTAPYLPWVLLLFSLLLGNNAIVDFMGTWSYSEMKRSLFLCLDMKLRSFAPVIHLGEPFGCRYCLWTLLLLPGRCVPVPAAWNAFVSDPRLVEMVVRWAASGASSRGGATGWLRMGCWWWVGACTFSGVLLFSYKTCQNSFSSGSLLKHR